MPGRGGDITLNACTTHDRNGRAELRRRYLGAVGGNVNKAPPANTVAFMATLHRRRTAVAEPWRAAWLPPSAAASIAA
jgi:hypothetical protein